jgi:phosphopantetheinyl transferase
MSVWTVTLASEPVLVVVGRAGAPGATEAMAATEAVLAGEQRERFEGLRTAEARRDFLISRALARHVLGEPVRLVGAQGRPPRLEGDPRHVSLAHAGGAAALALAPAELGGVGVDVEPVRPIRPSMRAAGLHADERDATPDDETFFRRWTAKEARMKLAGQGLALSPRRLRVDLDGQRVVDAETGEAVAYRWARHDALVVSWMVARWPAP